jgi:hypothetical protein
MPINEFQELDERLREVERVTASITSTINNVSTDISELKNMFRSFLAESTKIATIEEKIRNIDRIDKKVQDLDSKQTQLTSTFIAIQAEHSMCQLSKGRSEDVLRELGTRFGLTETRTQAQLAQIQADLTSLKQNTGRVDKMFWNWGNKLGFLFITGMLYLFLTNANEVKSVLSGQNPIIKVGEKAVLHFNEGNNNSEEVEQEDETKTKEPRR